MEQTSRRGSDSLIEHIQEEIEVFGHQLKEAKQTSILVVLAARSHTQ